MKRRADVSDYRIETGQHGALIFGDVALSDMEDLCRLWTRRGWNMLDAGIAAAAGATFAFTSEKASAVWRQEIEEGARGKAEGDRELEWVNGTDTGLSSLYLLRRLGLSEAAKAIARKQLNRTWDKHPSPLDPADLGRCIRLLDLFPEWRARLELVADDSAEWAALIGAWAELEALYREELAEETGYARRTYARMQELRKGRIWSEQSA